MVYVRSLFNEKWPFIETDKNLIEVYKLPKGPSVTLPKFIKLNEEVSWLIGFYLAEGSRNYYPGIGASNCNFELLSYFECIMEKYFLIGKNEWTAYVKSSNKNLDVVKEKWKSIIKENIPVYAYFNELANEDVIELRINNTLLSILFNRFLMSSLEDIPSDRNLALSFLKGYEVGDGSVIQRDGYLHGIAITTKDESHKDILCKILKKLYQKNPRVRMSKNKYYEISLDGVNVMTEFILDGNFELHKEKRNKLIKAYLRKVYTKSHIRYWKALKDNKLSVKELAESAKRSHWSVRDAMSKDCKLGLVKIEIGKIPHKQGPYHVFYSLTGKCNNLLDILNGGEI